MNPHAEVVDNPFENSLDDLIDESDPTCANPRPHVFTPTTIDEAENSIHPPTQPLHLPASHISGETDILVSDTAPAMLVSESNYDFIRVQ